MIVVSKLKCPECGHSGAAEWKAYRPKFVRDLRAVRGRFIPSGPARRNASAFLCEGCRCIAHTTEEPAAAYA